MTVSQNIRRRFGRKRSYTDIGIRRLSCYRCGKKASQQWNVCADGKYRPICRDCDIALNALVLQFMGDPDWKDKLQKYEPGN